MLRPRFSIHSIFAVISPIFRRRRFRTFIEKIKPTKADRILDVGGYPATWSVHPPCGRNVDIINLDCVNYDPTSDPEHSIKMSYGNGCELEFEDKSYEVLFSNSVIEHVGTWENQQRFANEARRVGGRLWIQTPAREFFIEPHYIAPFVHWLPRAMQKRLLRNFTIWGWMERPSNQRVDDILDEIRLITFREMQSLFPDCEIIRERFLFFFTKSYVAFRND